MTAQTNVRHEGLLAATFADGGLGSGYSNGRVLVARIGDEDLAREQWQYRPAAEVTGWVMACSCGWRGRPWVRVAERSQQDPAARRSYSQDASPPRGQVEDSCDGEYLGHIRPYRDEALAEVTTLAHQEHADVDRRLADAVGRARALGASWTGIGAAAGSTPEAARERWRNVPMTILTSKNVAQIGAVLGGLLPEGYTDKG